MSRAPSCRKRPILETIQPPIGYNGLAFGNNCLRVLLCERSCMDLAPRWCVQHTRKLCFSLCVLRFGIFLRFYEPQTRVSCKLAIPETKKTHSSEKPIWRRRMGQKIIFIHSTERKKVVECSHMVLTLTETILILYRNIWIRFSVRFVLQRTK